MNSVGRPSRKEVVLCGLATVRARFERNPASIQRLFFDLPMSRRIGPMCRSLASARKVYRCVDPSELEKIAGSVHHGGIVAVVDASVLRAPTREEIRDWAAGRKPLLLLDRIGNAHNLGAIARTAAFFGVSHIILPNDPAAALPGDAAYRVAEGGLEQIHLFRVPNLAELARDLVEAGYEVIGAAARGGRPKMSPGGKAQRPVALALGNEETGLSSEMAAACSRLVTIPGSGQVESLNVSVAAAVLMWELMAKREV